MAKAKVEIIRGETRFVDWLVLDLLNEKKDGKYFYWAFCRCVCGVERRVLTCNLRAGSSVGCGCAGAAALARRSTTHGMSGTRIHGIWKGIHNRCTNPNTDNYRYYGARGITLDPSWTSFETFWDYVRTLLPSGATDITDDLTVDRCDGSGNYAPGNIRLVTHQVNCRNKSNTVMLTINGVTRSLAEWCEVYGAKYTRVAHRIRIGWDAERALTAPARC